jgi:hypothetical protein
MTSPRGDLQHASDTDLVLHLDHEDSRTARERTEAHLASCWSCQRRLEELRHGIYGYVELRQRTAPRPSNDLRARFLLRLAAEEHRTARHGQRRPRFWMPMAASAAAVLLVWTAIRSTEPAAVSAGDLLRQSLAGEETDLPRRPPGTVRLRLSRKEAGVWRTAFLPEKAGRTESGDAQVAADFERECGARPELSATGFRKWADRLQASLRVESTMLGDQPGWRIVAEPARRDTGIRFVALTVRAADRVPVVQQVVLSRGGAQVIYALSVERTPVRVLPGLKLAPPPLPPPAAPTSATARKVETVHSPAESVGTAALAAEAHYILHEEGLCLNGAVAVSTRGGRVRIEGVVENEAVRDRLRERLLVQPLIAIGVETLSRVRVPMPDRPDLLLPRGDSETDREFRAAADKYLRGILAPHSSDNEAFSIVSSFSREAVALAQEVLQHAWAFHRLREQFPPEHVRTLAGAHRLLLQDVMMHHAGAADAALNRMARQLRPVLPGEAAAGEAQTATAACVRLDRAVRILFAGLSPGGDTLPAVLAELSSSLASAPAAIDRRRTEFLAVLQPPATAAHKERPKQ